MGEGSGVEGQGGARGSGYRQLKAWQKADDLAFAIWRLSRKIGRDDYWLTNQLRRASSSVPANIVEGYSRLSLREYLHHLSIARLSLAETEYWLHFAERLEHLTVEEVQTLSPLMTEAGNLLYGLIRALAKRLETGPTQANRYLIRDSGDSPYGRNDDEPDLSNLDP